ncbi:ferredoxin--NADP reductase [Geopsychrobacter electrodiphilus]|uniref:ferredoxin--NADP reductase n=1 Tax=Geopsychrobacter electrodiphilus TaxID=225196 RepID=UPI0003705AAD|nr:FAD-binding oxidoreductase [Geopsychrobacter electrodiphilus]
MQSLIVHRVIAHTDQLIELQLERGDISFAPGNCVALFKDDTESRPYSIASGTGEKLLRFLIRRVPQGLVSNWLAARQAGDRVQASEPFGWFQPGRSAANEQSVFIATGTGIAPFLSYLRSTPERSPLCCLYGVSFAAEAFALDELQALPDFQLAVSRQATDSDFHGRITGLLEQLPLGPQIHYYLCGLDAMIDEVSGWLERHNIDYTQIHREVFFYADEI